MNEKISVIVPVYNAEKYLEKCVKSILNQTYSNFEILLINDGSTDNSDIICDKIKNLDDRIKVFHRENSGVSATRNFGLENSTGNLITFIDSDDFIKEDMLEILYNNLEKFNADISIGKVVDTFDENYIFKEIQESVYNWDNENAMKEILKAKKTSFFPVAKLFRKNLFEKIKFNDNYKLAEDALLITEILLSKKLNVVCSNREVYAYLHHKNSATTNIVKDSVFDTIKVHSKIFDMIIEKFPKLKIELMERKYWSYFTVFDKIILAKNDDFLGEKEFLRKKIKKNFFNIMKIKGFTKFRKLSLCLLMISEKLYVKCIKYKNKNL